jgi:hypothetical protein
MSTTQKVKPANATWVAKAKVSADDPTLDFPLEGGADHPFAEVDLSWYGEGRLKISIAHGTPGVIRQAYLTGADRELVIEVAPRSDRAEAAEDEAPKAAQTGKAFSDEDLREADEYERGVRSRQREVLLQEQEGKTP